MVHFCKLESQYNSIISVEISCICIMSLNETSLTDMLSKPGI